MSLLVLLAGLAVAAGQGDSQEALRGFDSTVALGAGHIFPLGDDRYNRDWPGQAVFEVSVAPEGPRTRVSASDLATVETGYETVSLIVLEARTDGWLRLAAGWLHTSALARARPALRFEPWERLFQSSEISPLYFRTQVRHALRVGPSESTALRTWIPADAGLYSIEAIEFRGDWARVRLNIPSGYCDFSGPPPVVREGWVRWRDSERGPWLWYYTRGC